MGANFGFFILFLRQRVIVKFLESVQTQGLHSVLHFFSDFTLFVGFIVRTEDLFNSRVPSAATWRY